VKPLALILPLYFVIATAIGFADFRMRVHPDRGFDAYPRGVVDNTEDPPGKYRVLAPFAFEGLVAATGWDRQLAGVVFRWVTIAAGLLATHWMLATWFSPVQALSGTMFSALVLLLTFTNSWPHPDHFVEWALCAAAVGAIARGHHLLCGVVIALAALNRETSAFLVLLYAVVPRWPWAVGQWLRLAGIGGVWALIYFGLRFWRGVAWYDPWQVARNIEFLGLLPEAYDPYFRIYAWFGLIILGPAAWIAWRSWRHQPRIARVAMAVVVPSFVVIAFCFSSLVETRIFTPLVPLVTVAVMFALTSADNAT